MRVSRLTSYQHKHCINQKTNDLMNSKIFQVPNFLKETLRGAERVLYTRTKFSAMDTNLVKA